MPRWLVTFVRMLPAVAGASVLSVIGLWLAREVIPLDDLRPSNDEVGNYIQALGTIYAVVAAFVVYVVWGQFNDARTQVEREASEICDLYRLADGFPTRERLGVQDKLTRYVDAVLDTEWEALAKNDEGPLEHTGDLLDEVWTILHACEPASECHKSLLAEALSRYSELTDVRTARLTSARVKIPLGLRLLLNIGAVIIVGSMYLIAIDRFWVHATITACLAGAVAQVLYIVNDLDTAFSGDWEVPRTAFERTQRYIRKRKKPAADDATAPQAAA